MPDSELLALATQHDATLLEPFAGYALRVLRSGRRAAVLVCTPDTTRALLEDAGCTMALDRHRWREDGESACRFTLDLPAVCPAR